MLYLFKFTNIDWEIKIFFDPFVLSIQECKIYNLIYKIMN